MSPPDLTPEPDWRCTACGETVPTTLGLCWSCEAPRPTGPGTAGATSVGPTVVPGGDVVPVPLPTPEPASTPGDGDARSITLELVCVVLVFGAWRMLAPLLEEWGLKDPDPSTPNGATRTFWDVLSLAQSLAVLWLVRRWRNEPAATFGLRAPRWSDLPSGVLVFLAYALGDLLVRWWTRTGWDLAPGPPQVGGSVGTAAVIVLGYVAGAAHEEIIWRGYALARLSTLTGSTTLAVVASSVLFGLLHYHYDAFSVFQIMVGGLVLALAFLRYRRVGPVVVGHALWNLYLTGWNGSS